MFSLCVFCPCVSVCVFSLCVFVFSVRVFSVCVFSFCVFSLCVFSLCFFLLFFFSLRVQEHDFGSFGGSPCVSRWSLQLTLALVFWCWLGCFLLVSVGELTFDLFLTSSNNLTATVESNAATERKKNLSVFFSLCVFCLCFLSVFPVCVVCLCVLSLYFHLSVFF